MPVICPTITALDTHMYRQQMERIAPFAKRVHIDCMDGVFAPTKSPDISQNWWPEGVTADVHVMYKHPAKFLKIITQLRPHLVIAHAEAEGNFIAFAEPLHALGIKVGIALLPETSPDIIKPSLEHIDHVLIFSGDLGHFGGTVDFSLLQKVQRCKELKAELEIGWDGGINDHTAAALIAGGVDVLNVGGYIQKSSHPEAAYKNLAKLLQN